MASDQCELDSFYRKFLGLRKFGRNATLRMESGPDGRCLVNLQLELPTRSEGYGVPIVVNGGEAHVPVYGGDAPVQDKQRVEHRENFDDRSGGGRNCRRQEHFLKKQKGGSRSRERRKLRREAERMRIEAEQASYDAVEKDSGTKFDTTEEVERNSEVNSDCTESDASEAESEEANNLEITEAEETSGKEEVDETAEEAGKVTLGKSSKSYEVRLKRMDSKLKSIVSCIGKEEMWNTLHREEWERGPPIKKMLFLRNYPEFLTEMSDQAMLEFLQIRDDDQEVENPNAGSTKNSEAEE